MAESFPGGLTAPLDWLNGILPMLPNANIDWIKHEVLVKARTFFDQSGAWRDWIGPIRLDPSTPFYSPELTDYKAELVHALDGYRCSDQTSLGAVRDADHAVHQTINSDPAMPQWFYVTPEGLLAIFPRIPEGVEEQVYLYVSMKPVDLCMPDWIRGKYFDAIRAGVLSAGYLMPGVNYKPDLGARYERRFHSQMSRATQEALSSGTALPQPLQMPFMALGSQRGRFSSTRAVSGRRW